MLGTINMDIYRTSVYIILQMFNMNVYIPLYAIEERNTLSEKIVMENVKVEPKGAFELFGASIKRGESNSSYYLEKLNIYKIVDSANEMVHGRINNKEIAFGTTIPDFSILKTILEHKDTQNGGHSSKFSPKIKIKSIEVKIPFVFQLFLHMPIVIIAVITFYLFLSFGMDNRGLSDKEIEKIPLYLYSEQTSTEKGCSICLEDFENGCYVRRLSCDHVFHKECVDEWFHRHFVCPICRSRALSNKYDECNSRGVHIL